MTSIIPIKFIWMRCMDYTKMQELYEAVIPIQDLWNETTMLTKYPNIMRGYIAHNINGDVIACAVVGLLEKHNIMYIDCFTISNTIRGNKFSYVAWNTFIEFVNNEWSEVNTHKIIIEVYHKNIPIWAKVMNINILGIDEYVTKPKLFTDNSIMGSNLSHSEAIDVYSEWQRIESNW